MRQWMREWNGRWGDVAFGVVIGWIGHSQFMMLMEGRHFWTSVLILGGIGGLLILRKLPPREPKKGT